MAGDSVPAEAEVIEAIGVGAESQQFLFEARTGVTAFGILIFSIGQIPEYVIASPSAEFPDSLDICVTLNQTSNQKSRISILAVSQEQ